MEWWEVMFKFDMDMVELVECLWLGVLCEIL